MISETYYCPHVPYLLSCNGHLLVKLWRLCQVSRALEVGDFENVGPTFTGGRNNLGRMDLDKPSFGQIITEQFADAVLKNGKIRNGKMNCSVKLKALD